MKEIVTSENSIYQTKQLFVKMLKIERCELCMMYPKEKTAKVYH